MALTAIGKHRYSLHNKILLTLRIDLDQMTIGVPDDASQTKRGDNFQRRAQRDCIGLDQARPRGNDVEEPGALPRLRTDGIDVVQEFDPWGMLKADSGDHDVRTCDAAQSLLFDAIVVAVAAN